MTDKPTQAEIIAFLNGEGPLEGCYFGDDPLGRGNFWWRKYLPLFAHSAAQDVRIKRLEEALNDAVATILAVRATASGDDWAAGAGHFSQLCLETLLRIKNTRAALEMNDCKEK